MFFVVDPEYVIIVTGKVVCVVYRNNPLTRPSPGLELLKFSQEEPSSFLRML